MSTQKFLLMLAFQQETV